MDDWRRQFDVNFFGAIAVTQAMLPLLRQHNVAAGPWRARIANMCSITGEVATPLFGAYSASKFALAAFGDALRLELRAHAIHVSTLIPGTIQSEIWRKEKDAVDAIRADADCRRLYGTLIDNVARYVFKCADKALPADRVARAVEHCFTARSAPAFATASAGKPTSAQEQGKSFPTDCLIICWEERWASRKHRPIGKAGRQASLQSKQ